MHSLQKKEQTQASARDYYDKFAASYELERFAGYHKLVDDLAVGLVHRYGQKKDCLEVGCGSGLILKRVAEFSQRAQGIDISPAMLAIARRRGLAVTQGTATTLPYRENTFDLAYSFKVLPHIGQIRNAMDEMSRVVRPGGFVIAEFYNVNSIRYLIKALKPPTAIASDTADTAVFTRYDRVSDIRGYLPSNLKWVTSRGIRIFTPAGFVHRIPLIGSATAYLERRCCDVPLLRHLGGFLAIVLQKRHL